MTPYTDEGSRHVETKEREQQQVMDAPQPVAAPLARIATPETAPLETWDAERRKVIKTQVCPKQITDAEFEVFMLQCIRSGLDPLLKQAFCVERRINIGTREQPRYITRCEFQPAVNGMLTRAESFPGYRGTTAATFHEGDEIQVDAEAGTVHHKFSPLKRGALIGAWARVDVEGRRPVVVVQYLKECIDTRNPVWAAKPTAMMLKCPQAAALRIAFPAPFGGLYVDAELNDEGVYEVPPDFQRPPMPEAAPPKDPNITDAELEPEVPEAPLTEPEPGSDFDPPPPDDDLAKLTPAEETQIEVEEWASRINGATLDGLKAIFKEVAKLPEGPVRKALIPIYNAKHKALSGGGK